MHTHDEVIRMYDEMEDICLQILEGWKSKGQKNYGDGFLELGVKGQFSDIWRKVKKLQRSIWEGQPLVGEQPEQIAAEIIPHCLMMIYCLQKDPTIIRMLDHQKNEAIGIAMEDISAGDALGIDLHTGRVKRVDHG